MTSISKFWRDFCVEHQVSPTALEVAFAFVANSRDAEILSDLVKSGIKAATTSLYSEQEDVPVVGMYAIVLNGRNEPVCVIQNKTVDIMPVKDVSAEHAYLEGEGDRSHESWRKVHEKFFERECVALGREYTVEIEDVGE